MSHMRKCNFSSSPQTPTGFNRWRNTLLYKQCFLWESSTFFWNRTVLHSTVRFKSLTDAFMHPLHKCFRQREGRRGLQWPLPRWYFQSVRKRKGEKQSRKQSGKESKRQEKKDTSSIKVHTTSIIWSTSGICFQSHSYVTHICISSMSLAGNQKKLYGIEDRHLLTWSEDSLFLYYLLRPGTAAGVWPVSVLLCCALKPLKLCMEMTNLRGWQLT